jgi:hypothetical protein
LEPEALGIDNCKGADMKFIMVELNEATVSVASNTSSIHRLQQVTSGVDCERGQSFGVS